jgi:PilZ domain
MQPEATTVKPSRRMLLGAKIIFNDRSSIFDCTVRNLSADGAELRMPSTLGVPDVFKLVVKPYEDKFDCVIAWRTETELGVTFRNAANQPASPLLTGLRLVK